jgi:hypothetical protein
MVQYWQQLPVQEQLPVLQVLVLSPAVQPVQQEPLQQVPQVQREPLQQVPQVQREPILQQGQLLYHLIDVLQC